jgi:hypothetical protein
MDPVTMAAATVAALSPYLVEAAKGAATKAGEAAYRGGARLFRFLRGKLQGADEQKALTRLEQEPEDADSQAALRIVLKESLRRDVGFRDELEALLKAIPTTEVSQVADVVGDGDTVIQAAGKDISINVGERK